MAESGELCEELGGYTYFWSGKPATERSSSGVAFAIKNKLARSLAESPKGINDRLITLRLHTTQGRYMHLVAVYAPTLTSPVDDKDKFYNDLRQVLLTIPSSDKLILLGDFNARVGTEYEAWKDVLGQHGIGKCNTNGISLLTLCAEFNLTITNTFFRLPEKYKTSWMHPRSKHWHLLDYIIVRRKDVKDVLITRAMRGAEGWTDHRLIRSKMRFIYKPPRRIEHKVPLRLAYKKLTYCEETRQKLNAEFESIASHSIDVSVNEEWHQFADSLNDIVVRVIGKSPRKNQDWFDDSDVELRKLFDDFRLALKNTKDTKK
ncbi:jg5032, partial [Pararge aegeria aegeria]